MVSHFQRKVFASLLLVPRGRVTTYKLLAESVGCKSAQAVGQALRHNPYAPSVPCHRVVKSDLCVGGFYGQSWGSLVQQKVFLLKEEGVVFAKNGKINSTMLYAPNQQEDKDMTIMEPTIWSQELATGVLWQDFQHKQLVENLQKLYKAIIDQEENIVIKSLLKFLDIYVADHFGVEEKYMEVADFPAMKDHVAEHEEFKKNYNELKGFYKEGSLLSGTLLCYDLNEWIIRHIKGVDKELGEFLREQHVS